MEPRSWAALGVTLLLASGLAGCMSGLAASVHVDYVGERPGGPQTAEGEVSFAPGSTPSASYYEERDLRHPGDYTVFDLTVAWAQQAGVELDVGYFDGLGFFLEGIDDVQGSQEDETFWALAVNGEAAMAGMGEIQVHDSDSVTWTLRSFA